MPHRLQLRELQLQDHAAVQALFARHGWPLRSLAGWRWALFDAAQRPADAVAGWVLQGPEGIVGFLGNLPQRLWQAGQPVPAATCTALLVDTAWRGQGAALLRAFSSQAGVQLLYTATANEFSAPLYRLYRYQQRGEAGLDRALRWVADSQAFARHALQTRLHRRLGALAGSRPGPATPAPAPAAAGPRPQWLRAPLRWAGWPAVPALPGPDAAAGGAWQVMRWPAGAGAAGQAAAEPLSARWQQWWESLLQAHPGLLADRQQGTLAWRLADPDLAGQLAAWLLLDSEGGMQGLALARAVAPAPPAAPRAELLDWCVLPHCPPAAQARLLATVGQWATQAGLPFLEARRCSGLALQQLAALHARSVPLPGQANWTLQPGAAAAADPAGWSMSCIDSDDWFCSHLHERPLPPTAGEAGGGAAQSA